MVVGGAVVYVLAPGGATVPPWLAWLVGWGLVVALAVAAVVVDIVGARRLRGRRRADAIALVVAAALGGAWLALLVLLLRLDCLGPECEKPVTWMRYLVLLPVVPLGGLAVVGLLVRRRGRLDRDG